ncbi:LamG-like jellyroll fold domain-containing protein [Cohnella hongkongensis]|uniref:LamG-like jellyroll fold domain-containing protein n=1 Tax=Cohnella hongkongensis TaxID=178337 RepID=A0ABV9FHX9_9BACL
MLGGGYMNFYGKEYIKAAELFEQVHDNFTYEFWVKPEADIVLQPEAASGVTGTFGQRYVIGAMHGRSNSQAGSGVSVGKNGIAVFEHAGSHLPATLVLPIALHHWTHVAVVYVRRKPHLYVNGRLLRAGVASQKEKVLASGVFGALIPYGYFVGAVDDIRIWNAARTDAQIAANMHVQLTGAEPGLVGCWNFDERNSLRATDCSRNRRHGEIHGARLSFFFPLGDHLWPGKYPRYILDHLDHFKRNRANPSYSQMMATIQNMKRKAYSTDVLMMMNVYRKDLSLLFHPVANELARRGYSVTMLMPKTALKREMAYRSKARLLTFEDFAHTYPVERMANDYFETHMKPTIQTWFQQEKIPANSQPWLLGYYQQYAYEKMLAWVFLKEIKPKCVYGIHFILHPGYLDGIRAASEQNKIPIYLMQHGFLFDSKVDQHDFKGADIVLLWGPYHKKVLEGKTDLKASIAIGNPKLEAIKAKYAQRWSRRPAGLKRICYISPNSPKHNQRSKEELELFLQAAKAFPEYEIIFKLHPIETRDSYSEYIKHGLISADQLSQQDLYELLLESAIVVGSNSSSIFEAAALGIPVAQISLPRHKTAHIVFERASSPKELSALIKRLLTDAGYRKRAFDKQKEWSRLMFGPLEGAAARTAAYLIRQLSD